MTNLRRYARPLGLLPGLLLLAGFAAAQGRGPGRMMPDRRPPAPRAEFSRFSLSLAGGYGFLERGSGAFDLKAEVQYGISRSFRIGLSAGYVTRGDCEGGMMRDGRGRMGNGLLGLVTTLEQAFARQEQAFGRDLRAYPLGLGVYYTLPLGRRWDAYLTGGGLFAFGSFATDRGAVRKNAFGGQAGLGFEYALTAKVKLAAEAGYRFLTFRNVKPPMPVLDPVLRAIANTVPAWMLPPLHPVDISLSGLSLRGGVKLGI